MARSPFRSSACATNFASVALQAEKEQLLDDIREMNRETMLKDLMISAFIPPKQYERILRHAQWDEAEGAWAVHAMALAGNMLRAQREVAAAQKAHMDAACGRDEGARRLLLAPRIWHCAAQVCSLRPPNWHQIGPAGAYICSTLTVRSESSVHASKGRLR